MHCGSRGVNGERVRGMHIILKLPFKLGGLRTCSEPPRLERFDHLVDLFLPDRWYVKRYKGHLLHWCFFNSLSVYWFASRSSYKRRSTQDVTNAHRRHSSDARSCDRPPRYAWFRRFLRFLQFVLRNKNSEVIEDTRNIRSEERRVG